LTQALNDARSQAQNAALNITKDSEAKLKAVSAELASERQAHASEKSRADAAEKRAVIHFPSAFLLISLSRLMPRAELEMQHIEQK
jgi:hypothetical protein